MRAFLVTAEGARQSEPQAVRRNAALRRDARFVTGCDMKRTAIVTGGGKRVGAAIVAALLGDGWTVVAHVHDAGDTVPAGAIKVVADLARADCGEVIFGAVDGAIDLLVNCAARFAWDALGEASAAEFDAHMAVNARGPMLLTEALVKRHRAGSTALVVNILDAKLAAPNPDFLSYTLSKYAAAGLTEIAARALAGRGIRVNAIAPALMLPSGAQDEANFAAVHALNPLERGVEVADVVGAIRFLVDQPAMTGQTLIIDGGQRFMALPRDVQFVEHS
jgi:NAD(P)-dependent dehydrogenase (short-subunit alcohol dehydrogenase family)